MDDLREIFAKAINVIREQNGGDPWGYLEMFHPETITRLRDEADAVLLAIEASDLVVVPVEPTEAMVDAGLPHIPLIGDADRHNVADVWEAMLTAYGQKGE